MVFLTPNQQRQSTEGTWKVDNMRNFVTAFEKALHELLTPKVTLDYFWR